MNGCLAANPWVKPDPDPDPDSYRDYRDYRD